MTIFMRLLLALALLADPLRGQSEAPAGTPPAVKPRVLIVVAHPDDESCFSVTVYEITHNLHGTVDQLVVTNGEGGYRYSLLAEPYYGAPLTQEETGRARLPEIRKQELLNAGRIMGISNHYFLDQKDARYTQDVREVLEQHWDAKSVQEQVRARLAAGRYDYVLALFPSPETHGGHKAATLTAFRAIRSLGGRGPVLLGCQLSAKGAATPLAWAALPEPEFATPTLKPTFKVDRTVRFGFKDALDYQIIANWVIAEHRSQGAFQMEMGKHDTEEFAVLDTGAAGEEQSAAMLFRALAATAVPRQ